MTHRILVIPVFITLLSSLPAHSATIRVGHGSGYDYSSITAALLAAGSGDTITVATGTYSSTGLSPETFPLILRDNVLLMRESSDSLPIIDGNHSNTVCLCENVTMTIEGFRITGGITVQPETTGGGMQVNQSNVTVRHCDFISNGAEINGGAVHCQSSTMMFENCRFESNVALTGGGLYAESGSNLMITGCVFMNNTAASTGGALHCGLASDVQLIESEIEANAARDGGGISCYACFLSMHNTHVSGNAAETSGGGVVGYDSTIDVRQCAVMENSAMTGAGFAMQPGSCLRVYDSVVIGNSAWQKGGGYYGNQSEIDVLYATVLGNSASSEGGGFYLNLVSGIIASSDIVDNTAVNGGGICAEHGTVMSCVNCLLARNYATEFGAAFHFAECSPVCLNCTITDNQASDGGGAGSFINASPIFTRCILWDNAIDEIFIFSGSPEFTFCDIDGGWSGIGNITSDPLFVTGPNGSFYLSQISAGQSADSPCVNTGNVPAASVSFTSADRTFYLDTMTTRTDEQTDSGMADLGYHDDPLRDPCVELGCHIDMPALYFSPGDSFFCNVIIHNPETLIYPDIPVFMILDVAGTLFFAPGFTGFDRYTRSIIPGKNTVIVLPPFTWPAGCGTASGIRWYAGMTNHAMTELFGSFDTVQFGWGS
ncbi:right-handed parallel beta-helix repeat-containing protein [bacterium]|nr:right-handed parallel beta-helix repeat-containing protein [candidate division CSSED10-310 bacterium]